MLALEVGVIVVLTLLAIGGVSLALVWCAVGKRCLPWIKRDLTRREIAVQDRDQQEALEEQARQDLERELKGIPAPAARRSIIDQLSEGDDPPERRHVGRH